MEYRVTTRRERGYSEATTTGEVAHLDWAGDVLPADALELNFLIDLSGARLASLPVGAIRDLAKCGRRLIAPCRIAVYVTTGVSFGLARMWESLRATDGVQVCVFRQKEDAENWLLAAQPSR
jgi:hypothetical protein